MSLLWFSETVKRKAFSLNRWLLLCVCVVFHAQTERWEKRLGLENMSFWATTINASASPEFPQPFSTKKRTYYFARNFNDCKNDCWMASHSNLRTLSLSLTIIIGEWAARRLKMPFNFSVCVSHLRVNFDVGLHSALTHMCAGSCAYANTCVSRIDHLIKWIVRECSNYYIFTKFTTFSSWLRTIFPDIFAM